MKKKFKKLSLTTETLRHLNEPDLQQVAGATAAQSNCTGPCSECTLACSGCTDACSVCIVCA
ncbi:MAG TPA: class I lanthipeptide [Thermoanaerobaculia bacterium]|nr:class I lanthipeptide [Thermoanaerobaculia bacterium]